MSRGEQFLSPPEQIRLQIHVICLSFLFLCEIDKGPHTFFTSKEKSISSL